MSTYCLVRQVYNGLSILILHVLLSPQEALFEDELDYVQSLRILVQERLRNESTEERILSPGLESQEMKQGVQVFQSVDDGCSYYSRKLIRSVLTGTKSLTHLSTPIAFVPSNRSTPLHLWTVDS